ncbi:hypothetical protein H6F73_17630 [Microcoleus sp. FACHB-68]|nr:hypothetical protein [Microcoleus sp. FACHB-68]
MAIICSLGGRLKTQQYGLKSWAWLLQIRQQLIAAVNRQLEEQLNIEQG